MDEQQFKAIFDYVSCQRYPDGYTKNEKYVLRRCCKNYKLQGKQLFYEGKLPDGLSPGNMRQAWSREGVYGVPHLTTGGHSLGEKMLQ